MLGTKFAIKGITLLFRYLFKYAWLWVTIIMLSSVMIGSINQGIEQKDWSIPAKDLGIFLVSADGKIYEEVQDLEFDMPKQANLSTKILNFLDFSGYLLKNLFDSLWMLFFNFMLFYKLFLFILGDVSKKRRAILSSVTTMVVLQILVSGIPFKGVYALIKFGVTTLGVM